MCSIGVGWICFLWAACAPALARKKLHCFCLWENPGGGGNQSRFQVKNSFCHDFGIFCLEFLKIAAIWWFIGMFPLPLTVATRRLAFSWGNPYNNCHLPLSLGIEIPKIIHGNAMFDWKCIGQKCIQDGGKDTCWFRSPATSSQVRGIENEKTLYQRKGIWRRKVNWCSLDIWNISGTIDGSNQVIYNHNNCIS